MDTGELEYWRTYFKSAKSDIIEVIENAVMVAALDFPTELKLYRVRISEKLYSPHWSDFFRAELSVPKKDNVAGFGVENKDKKFISNRFYRNGSKLDDGDCKRRLDGNGRNDNNVDNSMNPVSCIPNRLDRNGSKSVDGGCKSRLDGDGGGKNTLVSNLGKLKGGGGVETKVQNENNVDKSMSPISCIPNRLDRNGAKSVEGGCKSRLNGNGGGKNILFSNRGKLEGGGRVETKVQNDNNVDKSMSPISCFPNRLDRNGSGFIHGGCKSWLNDGDVSGKNSLVGNGGKLEGSGGGGCVETRFDRSRNNNVDMFMTPVNIFSDLEAEALFDEIDEENQIVSEVLKIKEILDNCVHQSDTILLESLRKLQLVVVSVEILKMHPFCCRGTQLWNLMNSIVSNLLVSPSHVSVPRETLIGRAVKPLCNHGSMRICRLALMLIKDWRKMVDEWMTATPMISETLNDSVNPPPVNDDQPGLPLPPLDVGAFFTGPISHIELSDQFFDGMDDDGNPQSSAQLDNIQDNGKKSSPNKHEKLKSHLPKEVNNDVIIKEEGVAMKQEPVLNATKWPNNNKSGAVRYSTKQNLEEKLLDETRNSDAAVVIPKRPPTGQHDNFKFSEEKLEATRRKLQQGYEQAKDAKKQRTTQFMDLHEIPKQVQNGHKNTQWRRQKKYGPRFTYSYITF